MRLRAYGSQSYRTTRSARKRIHRRGPEGTRSERFVADSTNKCAATTKHTNVTKVSENNTPEYFNFATSFWNTDEGVRAVEADPFHCVIPAWSAGIQADMDVTEASWRTWVPQSMRHDDDLHFHPLWTNFEGLLR